VKEEMSGGTFTITNLGMFGVDAFTPIINPPEAAILGVGRIVEKPVVVDGKITIEPMTQMSLSFDHRIVDGAPAASFLSRVKELLENALPA
jgi:pyruvate dehydrogenase E2 component (dihydrolipoamide acetyltransferase)